jgi:hypothetical protein
MLEASCCGGRHARGIKMAFSGRISKAEPVFHTGVPFGPA